MQASHREVSIHAPAWGATSSSSGICTGRMGFQSTPPAWGATKANGVQAGTRPGFNPRPPRGGRPAHRAAAVSSRKFQSTPPAWGATRGGSCLCTTQMFQSTPPAWGATRSCPTSVAKAAKVSIHAPRVGGDEGLLCEQASRALFQSTPPRGGRPAMRA